jgi:uncharacterized protein with NAD-binding domain and iron-sulfur cluster
MPTDAVRTKVAVLGGGVGGMVAAYWLTSTPELCQQFEVTVHQMGWRLGGKGASGRNLDEGSRIEEHGLHIWFGFYDNAFLTMRQCYEELEQVAPRPAICPIRTFDDAFAPSPVIGLYEYYGGQWLPHTFAAPEKPSILHPELGMEGPLPSIWHLVSNGIEWAIDTWEAICDDFGLEGHRFPHLPVHKFVHLAELVEVHLDEFDIAVKEHLVGWIQKMAGDIGRFTLHEPEAHAATHFLKELVVAPLVAFKDELWEHVVESRCDNPRLRVFFTTFDTFISTMSGVLEEDVLTNGFLSIDDQELSAFLGKHGANPFTLELDHSPFLRGWYDAAFAYDCTGDTRTADLAAGTGIHGILRLIGTYKGYVAYKMQAGMGDTIFGPFYEVLAARGVRFEFFHEATELVLDDDGIGDGAVTAIRMTRQAEFLGGVPYAPLVDVGGLPCWPNRPLWDQLIDGDALRATGLEFEHGQSAPGASEFVLMRGQDFDRVVLAIPPAAQETLCRQLRWRSPAYAAMAAHSASVMTQAGQVWTRSSLHDMGSPFGGPAIATSFVEPVDTYCDMSHLLDREDWGADPPLGVAYFCGVMADQPDQATADREVAASIEALLHDYATVLWPEAADDNGAFDWSHLHAPGRGATPTERLAAQYLRANTVPTERYVLTPAGSTVHRMASDALVKADSTGPDHCPNLVLAGDWTLNGVNGGCVEAATMSGMQAARTLCGTPAHVSGENVRWLSRVEQ